MPDRGGDDHLRQARVAVEERLLQLGGRVLLAERQMVLGGEGDCGVGATAQDKEVALGDVRPSRRAAVVLLNGDELQVGEAAQVDGCDRRAGEG